MGLVLLQIAPWVKTLLVVVVLLVALVQVVRLKPPARRRDDTASEINRIRELLGETGRVLTPLRPVGICEFGGHQIECAAEGQYVQVGETVRVVRVEGMQPTVRVADGVLGKGQANV